MCYFRGVGESKGSRSTRRQFRFSYVPVCMYYVNYPLYLHVSAFRLVTLTTQPPHSGPSPLCYHSILEVNHPVAIWGVNDLPRHSHSNFIENFQLSAGQHVAWRTALVDEIR